MLPRHTNSTPIRSFIASPFLLVACVLLACEPDSNAVPAGSSGAAAGTDHPASGCTAAARVASLPPQLQETSGVAASRSRPDVLWLHNDSKKAPLLYAMDRAGRVLAQVPIPDAGTRPDWEDIAIGPCRTGDCLYLADIGDNYHDREDRALLRFAEPALPRPRPISVERFPFRYPDGPRDAEAIFVLPDTSVFVISKGRRGAVEVYRYPPPLRARERVTLRLVQHLSAGVAQLPDLVTGASASPAGDVIAVRTYTHLQLYRLDGDTLAPLLPGKGHDLTPLGEPQGEAVAVAADGTIFLGTETGPARAAPFLSALRCTP